MSIAKPMTEGEPGGIVGSLSDDDASSDIQSRQSLPPPPPPSESPNRNPNPKPGEPGIPSDDASSDIKYRQSDFPNPKPMTERSRPEEADHQIEPETNKSCSIKPLPKGFEYAEWGVIPRVPRLYDDKAPNISYPFYFPDDPSYKAKTICFDDLPSLSHDLHKLTPPPLLTNIKCGICGGDHDNTCCSYWVKIPDGAKLVEGSCYHIVCQCNLPFVDGVCCRGCPPRPRKILPKYFPLHDPNKPNPLNTF